MPSEMASTNVVVVRSGHPGLIAGLLGCVLGVFGIFFVGIVFVPLAGVCSLVGLVRGLMASSGPGIGASLLGGALTFWGFVASPSLWLLTAGMMIAPQFRAAPSASPTQVASVPEAQRRPAVVAPRPAPAVTPAAPEGPITMQEAQQEAFAAVADCKERHVAGQLPSHLAVERCAEPRMVRAFQRANYRYMDLIGAVVAKREELAEEVDLGRLTLPQANFELSRFMTWVTDRERQRDSGQ